MLVANINHKKRAAQRVRELVDDCSPFFMQPDLNEKWGYREKKFDDQTDFNDDIDKRES